MRRAFAIAVLGALVLAAAAEIADDERAAWAAAPPGRFVAHAQTVHDTRLNVHWQRNVTSQRLEHADAARYCENLELDSLRRWRLPTAPELQTIVDPRTVPTIDTAIFGMTPVAVGSENLEFRSSTRFKDGTYFFVLFSNGNSRPIGGPALVRCVRDPQ